MESEAKAGMRLTPERIHSIQDVPELARRLNEAILRLRESAHIIWSEDLVDDEEYQEEIAYIDSLEAIPEKK